MKVPLPNLDDRRWADLVDEGRSLIPAFAPEWTDHNVHDPGITLMELWAWVAEMDVYWLNRITDEHRRKFISLIGVVAMPPRPARTVLSFEIETAATPLSLPASIEFCGRDAFGHETRFRTLEDVTAAPGGLKAVQVKSSTGFKDLTARWRRGESFGAFGEIPEPGAELYLGFSRPFPTGEPVSLYLKFAGAHSGEDERRRLIEEMNARRLLCRTPHAEISCVGNTKIELSEDGLPDGSDDSSLLKKERVPPHHGARTAWEFLAGAGGMKKWAPLKPEMGEALDDTRSMTLDGRVVLRVAGQMAPDSIGKVEEELYYIRCRFIAGAYDAPPSLQKVIFNAAPAEQSTAASATGSLTIEAVFAGFGEGKPFQETTLLDAPIDQDSLRLFTLEEGDWREWSLRRDFDASARGDAHFLLDATAGAISFGDGEHGRVPPRGCLIFADYRATRAEAGNLEARSVTRLADSPRNRALLDDFDQLEKRFDVGQFGKLSHRDVGQFGKLSHRVTVSNPLAAGGGLAAEDPDAAAARAIELMNGIWRAVTLADYEALSMKTPGVRLARVKAWAGVHPSFPCLKAPGMITLIVLPAMPVARPQPSAGLRRAVAAYLRHRRLVGSRVEVVGPDYREVSVRAKVKAFDGVSKAALEQRIMTALDDFFSPLEGGPEGAGWPFGRDVYRSEILQTIDEVAGVDHVVSMEMIAGGCDPQCGNICLAPTQLVAAGRHEIEVI